MLKLKLHFLGHLMQRTNSLEKTLILGKIKGKRIRGQQRMRWSQDPLKREMATHSRICAWEIPLTEESGGLQSMGLQRVRSD